MMLERPPSPLSGVRFGAIARHEDARGTFRELWRAPEPSDPGTPASPASPASAAPARPFVQANLSTSGAGVLRGLHLHRRQLDYWVVASGTAFVTLVDVRLMLAGNADRPTVETRQLGADDWVLIPEGVAHGFLALEPLELVYLVTNWYDGSDELGFAWDDPTVGVPWPAVSATSDGRPIVSERDASNPSLADLLDRMRAEG